MRKIANYLTAFLKVLILSLAPAAVSNALPTIQWSQSAVTQIIAADERATDTVSFTTSAALNNIFVRVVPELEPFVSVIPSHFNAIAQGEQKTVTIIFANTRNIQGGGA